MEGMMAGSEATASEMKPLDVQTIEYASLPSDAESVADSGDLKQVESDAAERAGEVREVHAAASEATPLLLRQHLLCHSLCRAKQLKGKAKQVRAQKEWTRLPRPPPCPAAKQKAKGKAKANLKAAAVAKAKIKASMIPQAESLHRHWLC